MHRPLRPQLPSKIQTIGQKRTKKDVETPPEKKNKPSPSPPPPPPAPNQRSKETVGIVIPTSFANRYNLNIEQQLKLLSNEISLKRLILHIPPFYICPPRQSVNLYTPFILSRIDSLLWRTKINMITIISHTSLFEHEELQFNEHKVPHDEIVQRIYEYNQSIMVWISRFPSLQRILHVHGTICTSSKYWREADSVFHQLLNTVAPISNRTTHSKTDPPSIRTNSDILKDYSVLYTVTPPKMNLEEFSFFISQTDLNSHYFPTVLHRLIHDYS